MVQPNKQALFLKIKRNGYTEIAELYTYILNIR